MGGLKKWAHEGNPKHPCKRVKPQLFVRERITLLLLFAVEVVNIDVNIEN
jgi:hypothetical protein